MPDSSLRRERLRELAEAELREGRIAYNPPERMRVGELRRVEARIAHTPLPDDQPAGFTEDLAGGGQVRIERLQIGTDLIVTLQSRPGDFTIAPVPPDRDDRQSLYGDGFASWQWDVLARRFGARSLFLVVKVVAYDSDREEELIEKTFEREIHVAVNPAWTVGTWLSEHETTVLGGGGIVALITAVAAAYTAFSAHTARGGRRAATDHDGSGRDRADHDRHATVSTQGDGRNGDDGRAGGTAPRADTADRSSGGSAADVTDSVRVELTVDDDDPVRVIRRADGTARAKKDEA